MKFLYVLKYNKSADGVSTKVRKSFYSLTDLLNWSDESCLKHADFEVYRYVLNDGDNDDGSLTALEMLSAITQEWNGYGNE